VAYSQHAALSAHHGGTPVGEMAVFEATLGRTNKLIDLPKPISSQLA
jgi:hypothetical protein